MNYEVPKPDVAAMAETVQGADRVEANGEAPDEQIIATAGLFQALGGSPEPGTPTPGVQGQN